MRSMQTGFIYQPQPAPEMPPGAVTAPLIAGPITRSIPRPAAPRPPSTALRPAQPGTTRLVSSPTPAAKSAPSPSLPAKKKRLSAKVVIAIFLNLGALAGLLWFFRPFANQGGWQKWFSEMKPETEAATSSAPNADAKGVRGEGPGIKGRYLRISMQGKGKDVILSLAEVQVFSGTENIALQGSATQSSEEWGGAAERAIDNNTDGIFDHNSISHTRSNDPNPWWQLDLGSERVMNTAILWNRTDKGEYAQRLKNFTVSVLDAQQKVLWQKKIEKMTAAREKLVLGE